jgi:hypothetical protein
MKEIYEFSGVQCKKKEILLSLTLTVRKRVKVTLFVRLVLGLYCV